MRFKSIRLNNIRSYVDEQINFPEGSMLLSGDIGSGKSTILLALEFALFGVKRGDISATSLLRNGATFGAVELAFEVQDKEVIINRSLKRTNDSVKQEAGYIVIDGQKQDGTTTELKSKVLDLLGYPQEVLSKGKDLIYRFTVYTPQEEMKQILFEDSDARLDTLRKVFNIDKYKRIKENVILTQRELRTKKRLLERDTEQLPQFLEIKKRKQDEKQEKEKTLNEYSEKLKKVEENIKDGEEKLKQLEEKISALQEIKKKVAVAEQKKEHLVLQKEKNSASLELYAKQIKNVEEKIENFPKQEPIKAKPDELEKEINEKQQKIDKIKQDLFVLEQKEKYLLQKEKDMLPVVDEKKRIAEKLSSLQEKYDKISKEVEEISQLEELKEKQEKQSQDLLVKLTESEAVISQSNSTIEKISKIDSCPLCLQNVGDDHKQEIMQREKEKTQDAKLQSKSLQKEYDSAMKKIGELKEKLLNLQEKEREKRMLDVEIRSLTSHKAELEKKEESIKQVEKEKEELKLSKDAAGKENIDKIEKEIGDKREFLKKVHTYLEKEAEKASLFEKLQEFEAHKKQIMLDLDDNEKEQKNIEKELKELEEKHKGFADVEATVSSFKDKMQKLQEMEKSVMLKKMSIEKEIESCSQIIQEADKNIAEKEKSKKQASYIDNLLHWFDEHFLNLMNTMEKSIMASLYHEFNSHFVSWFTLLIEDENLQIRLDDTFSPVVIQNGYETGLESLSGGEKTSVALAYRLALNKVVNNFVGNIHTKDVIILDEPTDGFSSEQLDKVREVLEQLGMKQVIIVSHESKIESFVDNVMHIAKTDHTSKILG